MRTPRTWLVILAAIAMSAPLPAQDFTAPKPEKGHITDTVIDPNSEAVSGATVVLEGPVLRDPRSVVSDDNGFFEFDDLDPGTYNVSISAKGFANWTSAAITVKPGQYVILTGSMLKIPEEVTTVSVVYSPVEVATEEVKLEERQRVFGIIPNFYTVYNHDAAPLTTKLKFELALKVSTDAVTIVGTGVLAAINQAADIPNYPQGFKGYGQRVGAVAADGLSDIMIGGAILPSLLHQDPRYFYQGTGTNKSRVFHALSSPFICKGDKGRLQPNYSSVGGDLASAALSNAYYPASNRGARQTFQNFSVHVDEDTVGSLSLCGVASHTITVVEMRMLGRVEFNSASTVHPQAQPPVSSMLSMVPNSRFATFSSLAGAVNWMRSPNEKLRISSRKTDTPCCLRGS